MSLSGPCPPLPSIPFWNSASELPPPAPTPVSPIPAPAAPWPGCVACCEEQPAASARASAAAAVTNAARPNPCLLTTHPPRPRGRTVIAIILHQGRNDLAGLRLRIDLHQVQPLDAAAARAEHQVAAVGRPRRRLI